MQSSSGVTSGSGLPDENPVVLSSRNTEGQPSGKIIAGTEKIAANVAGAVDSVVDTDGTATIKHAEDGTTTITYGRYSIGLVDADKHVIDQIVDEKEALKGFKIAFSSVHQVLQNEFGEQQQIPHATGTIVPKNFPTFLHYLALQLMQKIGAQLIRDYLTTEGRTITVSKDSILQALDELIANEGARLMVGHILKQPDESGS